MATSICRGITVTSQDIERAIRDFDRRYPMDSNLYDSWLDKGTYKWALAYQARLYPPKHILSLATGMQTSDFIASEAKRVLESLGFQVISKP